MLERLAAIAASAIALAAHGAVTAKDAWIRGMAPGQKTGAAYMTLTSSGDAKLVGVSTPVAGKAQVHASMMMSGMVHMREIDGLELPAGQAVELKPGGNHIMLLEVSRTLRAGERVPLVLTVQDEKGRRASLTVQAEVRPLVP
jgi:periplasmic copper chaperone A